MHGISPFRTHFGALNYIIFFSSASHREPVRRRRAFRTTCHTRACCSRRSPRWTHQDRPTRVDPATPMCAVCVRYVCVRVCLPIAAPEWASVAPVPSASLLYYRCIGTEATMISTRTVLIRSWPHPRMTAPNNVITKPREVPGRCRLPEGASESSCCWTAAGSRVPAGGTPIPTAGATAAASPPRRHHHGGARSRLARARRAAGAARCGVLVERARACGANY